MNKLIKPSVSLLLVALLTRVTIPDAYASVVWTQQPPFFVASASAWLGDSGGIRPEEWWGRATADASTGVMKANIHVDADTLSWGNVYFSTSMADYFHIGSSGGTLFISGDVYLKGITGIGGVALAGGFYTAYSFKLWLTIVDTTSGSTVLDWLVNEWKDEETVYVGGYVNRDQNFDWDYSISQTSVPVQAYHTYKTIVKFTGWVYVAAVVGAYAQSDIDFETGDYHMTLRWLTFDVPSGGPGFGGGHGGCPFVSVWDGSGYVLDNSVLPRSLLSNGSDAEDYYRLEKTLAPREGKYSLLLSEFEREHSYFDQVKLLAIDHNRDVDIAVTPSGEILTYNNPAAPISVTDNYGNNKLNEIRLMDWNMSDPSTYFFGEPGDYLVLNFGQVNSDNAKLIVRDDYKKEYEDCHSVQLRDGAGVWQTVETLVPRAYWSMEAVNLSQYTVQGQDLWVRLYWKQRHRLDFVGLDTTAQAEYEVRQANLASATHSTQGDVKPLLKENDNQYAELIPGEQIQLEFTLPNNAKEARTYILYTKGHYYTITP